MAYLDEVLGDKLWSALDAPHFESALAIVLARNRADGRMRPVGSGFVAIAGKHRALVATAAHVVDQVSQYQQPICRPHRSALSEFLPQPKAIELEHRDLLVVTGTSKGAIQPVRVTGLSAFQDSDVGLLMVAPQDESNEEFTARMAMVVLPFSVRVGDAIAVLSNAGLDGIDEPISESNGDVQLEVFRQQVLRVGKVLAVHSEGSMVYRGAACIETTIPAEAGMSGGPAFVVDEAGTVRVFGVVCSSIAYEAGRSERTVIALLPPQREQPLPGGDSSIVFYGPRRFAVGELGRDEVRSKRAASS